MATIQVFSATGEKKKTLSLPETLFGGPVNQGLMHQAVVMQQSNRRQGSTAHVKTRSEVVGSTRKLYGQKHTGRARRGPIRSPLMRGGGKAFGPRNNRNFTKDMPKAMRHAALRSCLAFQAKNNAILALEGYPDTIKTKTFATLLTSLPLEHGRATLFVLPEKHQGLELSSRNVPYVKTILASYLNPEDVMHSRRIVFLVDAITKAEKLFGKKTSKVGDTATGGAKAAQADTKATQKDDKISTEKPKTKATTKKAPAKKAATKKPTA